MRRQTVLLLLLVFIALAAATYWQNRQSSQVAPTPQIQFERVFPDLKVLDIGAIRLQDPTTNATFTLSRGEGGEWQALDVEGELNTETATLIARTMVLFPYEYTLPMPADDDLAAYGFNPNGNLLIQIVQINGEAHAVAIGRLTPSAASYYAVVDDREELYVIDRAPVEFLRVALREASRHQPTATPGA